MQKDLNWILKKIREEAGLKNVTAKGKGEADNG